MRSYRRTDRQTDRQMDRQTDELFWGRLGKLRFLQVDRVSTPATSVLFLSNLCSIKNEYAH